MKTAINEIGVIDKQGVKHKVKFKGGLNVVTGKSSTGKSAIIEIFDYCFGSNENTIPKGIITNVADIYYTSLNIDQQHIIIARDPNVPKKAFLRRADELNPCIIDRNYFNNRYFRPLNDFKKHIKEFFLDIDDVDESLVARDNRYGGRKSPTPSIRSFTSFMLQHQNLIANKHALFYRFDEKEKRDQVIEHTKIFLGIADQKFFLLSQEQERLNTNIKRLERTKETNNRSSDAFKYQVGPVLNHLYSLMGFDAEPLTLENLLSHPQDAKEQLDSIIIPENINHISSAITIRYNILKHELSYKTVKLRNLQRKIESIKNNIKEEARFIGSIHNLNTPSHVNISTSVCPFCHTEKPSLQDSAVKLQQAITKISGNLAQTRPMRAKFESSLISYQRETEELKSEITDLNNQISEIEITNNKIANNKSSYELVIMQKAKLFALLDTINMADDTALEKEIEDIRKQLRKIKLELDEYNIRKSLENASSKVNSYMAEIGSHFEFENSYKPINLKFSFETFDLYHLTPDNEKIYLRSMGSGANWLYCHVTLFLALHKYFAELGNACAIPSVLFLDQPTQVYFPNFNRDTSDNFDEQKSNEAKLRTANERGIDEDIHAVENLFTQISNYCVQLQDSNGFSPQIIVTDHADNLTLSNGISFDSLVNGNRWRIRGLINPTPQLNAQ